MDYSKDKYTTKEAANLLGMSEFTLRRKIRNKEINVIGKKGKSYIISKEEIERHAKEKGEINSLKILMNQAKDVNNVLRTKELSTISKWPLVFSPFLGAIVACAMSLSKLPDSKFLSNDTGGDMNIEFYKNYYKSRQKDLKIAKLELEKLMLDKDDTIEYKKKELDLRIEIESIEKNLQMIKMKIDNMDKWYNLLWGKVSFVYKK